MQRFLGPRYAHDQPMKYIINIIVYLLFHERAPNILDPRAPFIVNSPLLGKRVLSFTILPCRTTRHGGRPDAPLLGVRRPLNHHGFSKKSIYYTIK